MLHYKANGRKKISIPPLPAEHQQLAEGRDDGNAAAAGPGTTIGDGGNQPGTPPQPESQ